MTDRPLAQQLADDLEAARAENRILQGQVFDLLHRVRELEQSLPAAAPRYAHHPVQPAA